MSNLRVTNLKGRTAGSSPTLPDGVVITGVATATTFDGNFSGNAGGLTGTPDIAVRNITGVAATFTGVLTYEDVTNIDSVGIITARAGVKVPDAQKIFLGTGDDLQIYHSGSHSFIVDSGVGSLYIRSSGGNIQDQGNANQSWLQFNSGAGVEAHFAGNKKLETTTGGVSITGTLDTSSTATFSGGLAEKVNVKTQLAGANACAITDGNVILTTGNEPGNTFPNITGVHSILSSGQGFSVTVALKVNGSGTINGFQIDGVSQTIKWSGGSAPSAGSSGHDVFTFTAMKTGTGTSDYTVFGAATNYA